MPVNADPASCAKLTTDATRLACYDALFGKPDTSASTSAAAANDLPQPTTTKPDNWMVATDKSKMTDQKNVYLAVNSDNAIPGTYGGSGPAQLTLRCQENTTSAILSVNDHFLSDIQGYGDVEYRIDKEKMHTAYMGASTDNTALGLWNGGSAIPFIRQLMGHHRLVVRVTPYNESPVEATFDISGLDAVLPDLRRTCHW